MKSKVAWGGGHGSEKGRLTRPLLHFCRPGEAYDEIRIVQVLANEVVDRTINLGVANYKTLMEHLGGEAIILRHPGYGLVACLRLGLAGGRPTNPLPEYWSLRHDAFSSAEVREYPTPGEADIPERESRRAVQRFAASEGMSASPGRARR